MRCDGYSEEEVLWSIELSVRVHGWSVQLIEPSGDDDFRWAYTIGLTDHDLPELVVADIDLDVGHRLLNTVGRSMREGALLEEAAAQVRCRVGEVHVRHIEGDLVADWHEYYVVMRESKLPHPARFRQLIPGPDHFCADHASYVTDLSLPCLPGANRPQRRRRRHDQRS